MNHKPKQGGRMIWLDQIRRPICLLCMSHFSVPTFGKHLLTLSCHFPFWQMRHTRGAGYPSDRWSTGLQLHQRCYQQWSRGRFFHFFFTAVESQLGERQDWSQLIHGGFCENHLICTVLYSTANDSQPQMIPRPQMIPKMDRKWSSTASDPQSRIFCGYCCFWSAWFALWCPEHFLWPLFNCSALHCR